MASALWSEPEREGVFGWEILLNVRSGDSCLRSTDGVFHGPMPEEPRTNAFVVWVGRPVVVVSEGVRPQDFESVATALRQVVGADKAPVVFSLGRTGTNHVRAEAVCDRVVTGRELARAEAYVLVQCAWVEHKTIVVELGKQSFELEVEFKEMVDGRLGPVIT